MATVATKNEVITVIVIFTVEPDRQQELIDAIAEFTETVKQQPGFISANIHKSIDGVKVANYAQWQSQADYQNFVNNPDGIKAEEFFDHFVATNRNIFLVNAGHFGEEYRQTSDNIHGLPVYEVLADYQEESNGGNGYLRIMEFDPSNDRINVSSYSPTLDDFLTADESQFSLDVDFDRYVAPNPTVYFQNGVSGYQGTQDTWINGVGK